MNDMYIEQLDAYRLAVIECCRDLALSDDVLDEINDVFRRAYEHPSRFDIERFRDVITYALQTVSASNSINRS